MATQTQQPLALMREREEADVLACLFQFTRPVAHTMFEKPPRWASREEIETELGEPIPLVGRSAAESCIDHCLRDLTGRLLFAEQEVLHPSQLDMIVAHVKGLRQNDLAAVLPGHVAKLTSELVGTSTKCNVFTRDTKGDYLCGRSWCYFRENCTNGAACLCAHTKFGFNISKRTNQSRARYALLQGIMRAKSILMLGGFVPWSVVDNIRIAASVAFQVPVE